MKFLPKNATSFEDGEKRMFEMLGDYKIMALASSVNDHVTVRNVSCLFYDKKIYFKTDINFRKTKQLLVNPNVALCFWGIQVEGRATSLGSITNADGKRFMSLYETFLQDSYNKYSHTDTEILIEVTPRFVEIWDTDENGDAFQFFLDYQSEEILFERYD